MNRNGLTVWLFLSMAVLSSETRAEPVLLASFRQDALSGGGSGPIVDPHTTFGLQLPTTPPLGGFVDPLVGVGTSVVWSADEQGSFDFYSENDQYFDGFSAEATNDLDQWLGVYTPFGGYTHRESELFGSPSILQGAMINFIRLNVLSLDFVPLPELGGSEIRYDIRYDFYGKPVPDPSVMTLLVFGMAVSFLVVKRMS